MSLVLRLEGKLECKSGKGGQGGDGAVLGCAALMRSWGHSRMTEPTGDCSSGARHGLVSCTDGSGGKLTGVVPQQTLI